MAEHVQEKFSEDGIALMADRVIIVRAVYCRTFTILIICDLNRSTTFLAIVFVLAVDGVQSHDFLI